MGKLIVSADKLMLFLIASMIAFLIFRSCSQIHPWQEETLAIVQKNCPVGTSTGAIRKWLSKSGNVWKIESNKQVTIYVWSHTLKSKAFTSKEAVAVEVLLDKNHKISGYGDVYQKQLTWP